MSKFTLIPPGKRFFLLLLGIMLLHLSYSQETFPVNGVAEPKEKIYAFANATIVKDAQTTLANATMVIQEGKIIAAGAGVSIPKGAITIDCKGKYIYPSFIDIFSDYGIPVATTSRTGGPDFRGAGQLNSNTKGAFGWNQSVRPETDAYKMFTVDNTRAKNYRDAGFGTVLTHFKDGIARGTGVVVTLANEKENLVMVKEKAAALYSLNKGSSAQTYPASLMGSIALLRQTYLDAQWYKSKPAAEGTNLSLQAWLDNQSLPQIFDASDKWNDLRADRIGDEFGVQYIIKGGGNEYQRIKEVAGTKATYIISLNFPQPMDVEDPNDVRFIAMSDLKHWEMAPTNPGALEKANVPFCLTATDVKDAKQFMTNLQKALNYGLTENKAFEALTKTPATLLGVYDKVGSLEAGKLANFLITSGPIFKENTTILQNWIQGIKYAVKEDGWDDIKGLYTLNITSASGATSSYTLDVKGAKLASVISKDTLTTRFSTDGQLIQMNFSSVPVRRRPQPRSDASSSGDGEQPAPMRGGSGGGAASFRLSGVNNGTVWQGNGEDSAGSKLTWTATLSKPSASSIDSAKKQPLAKIGKVTYPFDGYGWEELPVQQTMLIKNATIWTNEKEGKLENSDILLKNGKIAQVGKNLSDPSAKVIDATGKFVTPGIIDEHSHIAAASINEGGQSVSSEVRIADNLDPEDVNIYRQLSGGVTTSHILHGSANTIGGQTQLIKLRWGGNDDDLKFRNWDPFIKFALGENVKRTSATTNNRFPETRMGVEEVLMDAFQRAKDYEKAMNESVAASKKKGAVVPMVRRDLELDALVEILNSKRFITAHSYVQSEITALLRVADKYNFKVNTFTHILEGYKVADKMKAQGSNASTFSDWWAYKNEVQDAIPYNASLMQQVGLNVCINSDDAEMARRLNQEAAKSVKYGGMAEEDAFKMVSLNPAKALHIEDRVGSIKIGKDADIVIWSDHPLSIYAKAEKTIVDGILYFDRERDMAMRKNITLERNRIIQKLLGEKRSGVVVVPAQPTITVLNNCGDHEHKNGLVTVEDSDSNSNQ